MAYKKNIPSICSHSFFLVQKGLWNLLRDIIMYKKGWHCCVDLASVSLARSSWRQALRSVQEAKCAKHAETCLTHGFDFAPFSFYVLRLFGPAAEEILTEICELYVSHARIRPWEAHHSKNHLFEEGIILRIISYGYWWIIESEFLEKEDQAWRSFFK